MKLFTSLLLAAALTGSGCASIGKPIASTGKSVAGTGTGILMVSGVNPLLIPVGIGLSIPFFAIGAPLYYIGHTIAGQKPDRHPFDP